MQVIYEASPGCPKTKKFSNGLHVSGIGIEAFPKPKNEKTNISGGTEESDNASKRGISLPPGELYCKPIYQQDCCFFYGLHPEFQSLYQNPWNPYEGHFYAMSWEYPPPVDSRVHYMPYNIFSQGYPNEFQFQEFQYFVVIDFEATCDKGKLIHPQEIIEFPSVLVNSVTGQLEASFQTYVRPSYHQHLTDFCRELTGIRQVEVDRGVPLSEALLMHDKWLEERGVKHTKFAVVTWSDWDCNVMLESECKYKRIRKPPYFNRWINLRVPFQEVYGNIRCNLKEAVEMAGLTWEGRPHCGLDDARNTARLLTLLMLNGFRFSITKSLPWPIEDPRNVLASMGRSLSPARQTQKPKWGTGSPTPQQPQQTVGSQIPQRQKQNVASPTPPQPKQTVGSLTLQKPKQNVESSTPQQPKQSVGSPTSQPPKQNVRSSTPQQLKQNIAPPTPQQPTQNIGSLTTQQPTQNVSSPTPQQPTQNVGSSTTQQPTQNIGSPTTQQPTQNVGSPTAQHPTQNVGSPTPQLPTQNGGSPTPQQSTQNVGSLIPQQTKQNMGSPTPQQPKQNISSLTPQQPTENVGTPTQQPIQNVGPPTPQQPKQNIGSPTPQRPKQNIGSPTPQQPTQKVGSPTPQQTTQNDGTPIPANTNPNKERVFPRCYCGVKCNTGVVWKGGPRLGTQFFRCGKWTVKRGAVCNYFEWASS